MLPSLLSLLHMHLKREAHNCEKFVKKKKKFKSCKNELVVISLECFLNVFFVYMCVY